MKKLCIVTVAVLVLAVAGGRAAAGPGGWARGPGMGLEGHERGEMIFPLLLRTVGLTPEQRTKIADIMRRHRDNLQPLFRQLHAAHDDLATKLLAPGSVTAADVAPAVQRLAQVRQQLMQEWVQAALEARAVLSPDQLAKAASVKQHLDALHAEMEKVLGPLPPPPGGDD